MIQFLSVENFVRPQAVVCSLDLPELKFDDDDDYDLYEIDNAMYVN